MTAGVIALVVIAATLFLGLITSLKRTVAIKNGDPMNVVVDAQGFGQRRFEPAHARGLSGDPVFRRHRARRGPAARFHPSSSQPFLRTKDGGRARTCSRAASSRSRCRCTTKVKIVEGRMFNPSSGEAIIGRGSRVATPMPSWATSCASDADGGRWSASSTRTARRSRARCGSTSASSRTTRSACSPTPACGCVPPRPPTSRVSRKRIDDDPLCARCAAGGRLRAKQSESANSLYDAGDRHRGARRRGRRVRRREHDVCPVQARTAEIGTLRALELLEALDPDRVPDRGDRALALLGFAIPAPCCRWSRRRPERGAGRDRVRAQTFTTNVITLRVSPSDLIGALGLALLVGVLGGLGPGAQRLRPIEALRKA